MAREHHEFDSPVDLQGSVLIGGRPLFWTAITIAVAALFLLFTNALAIRQWVEDMTPSPLQQRMAEKAQAWEDFTDSAGLSSTRALVRSKWEAAQAARFAMSDDESAEAR